MMSLSCTLTPWPDITEHALAAENLGYERVWVNDSPNVSPDVWMTLGSIAAATNRIGLGPAVLVPSLRHVVATASAIATLERMAPGRVAIALGTGNTGRRLLGKRPLPWGEVASYAQLLKGLLAGNEVEVDGAVTSLLYAEGMMAAPRVPPMLFAAMGPLGLEHARALADGVFRINEPIAGIPWCAVTVTGTVLDQGEDFGSSRTLRDAGPAVAIAYHGIYEANDGEEKLKQLPHGQEWLDAIAEVPATQRHLAVHGGHFVSTAGPDRLLVDGETIRRFSFTGHVETLRKQLDSLQGGGATEIVFHPTGKDTRRELEAFAGVMEPFLE
jgi:5,10-methylenetetrahydromethanopterin reductase